MTEVLDLCREAADLAATPIPAAEALQRLCRAVPAAAWSRRRRCGWSRSHYADPNANGTCGDSYESATGLMVDAPEVGRVGGQNSGSYQLTERGLWLDSDGTLWEACRIEGSWSQWQGSSSCYRYDWRRYTGEYDLAGVVSAVAAMVTRFRDRQRSRREAGAREAGELLTALAAAGY